MRRSNAIVSQASPENLKPFLGRRIRVSRDNWVTSRRQDKTFSSDPVPEQIWRAPITPTFLEVFQVAHLQGGQT